MDISNTSENVCAVVRSDPASDARRVGGFIYAVLEHEDGRSEIFPARNIITDAGDVFYAQKVCGETPTNVFANCVLGTGTTSATKGDDYSDLTPISGSNKAKSASYPKSNDQDVDNTGKGADVVTWLFEYAKADFNNTTINEGVITIASPIAGSPVLCRWTWGSPINKSANDTLKVFVNHQQVGV